MLMLNVRQLDQMSQLEWMDIDWNKLIDIRNVQLEMGLPLEQRRIGYLGQIKKSAIWFMPNSAILLDIFQIKPITYAVGVRKQ